MQRVRTGFLALLSRNSARRIIAQEGRTAARSFTPPINPELLRDLYHQCEGYVQRVFEKLQEEHGLAIKYSSLTRWLRQLGISLPGRNFQSPEDLNQQALHWSTVRMEQRPQGKAGLIPAQAFEYERTFLHELPAQLPAPLQAFGAQHR